MEVKSIFGTGNPALQKSLDMLRKTQQELRYQVSILYVFGQDNPRPELSPWLMNTVKDLNNPNLHFLWHRVAGQTASGT